MITNRTKTREDVLRIQELRRSNASAKHRNKKAYTRKTKHKKGWE